MVLSGALGAGPTGIPDPGAEIPTPGTGIPAPRGGAHGNFHPRGGNSRPRHEISLSLGGNSCPRGRGPREFPTAHKKFSFGGRDFPPLGRDFIPRGREFPSKGRGLREFPTPGQKFRPGTGIPTLWVGCPVPGPTSISNNGAGISHLRRDFPFLGQWLLHVKLVEFCFVFGSVDSRSGRTAGVTSQQWLV